MGDDEDLLADMSPMLRGQVASCSTGKWLKAIPFLRIMGDGEKDQGFITTLATRLVVTAYVRSERLPLGRLYIVRKGMVVKLWKFYNAGMSWGDDILLGDLELIDHAQAVAMTYTETYHLTALSFEEVGNDFPQQFGRVQSHIRLHLRLQRILIRALAKENGTNPRSFISRSLASGFQYAAEKPTFEQKVERLLKHFGVSLDSEIHSSSNASSSSAGAGEAAADSLSGVGTGLPFGLPLATDLPAPSVSMMPGALLGGDGAPARQMRALDAKLEAISDALLRQQAQIAGICQHLGIRGVDPGKGGGGALSA